jgi:hypothetical protein
MTPGDSVWINVTTGGTVVTSGAQGREVSEDGTRWIVFEPGGDRTALSLRIPVKEGAP